MYKVIGSDNREYGPASQETVRRWIAEGRANAESQAQAEGETGWRTLGSFPEFADALAAGSTVPPAPPTEPAAAAAPAGGLLGVSKVDADALATRLCARNFDLDIGSCVSRG